MKQTLSVLVLSALAAVAQQSDIQVKIMGGTSRTIAIPDFKGSGESSAFMDAFNSTLWNEIQNAGVLKMSSKSFYPLNPPQRPQDLRTPAPPRRGATEPESCGGRCLADWAAKPVDASYLAVGYAGVQGTQFVAFGYLFNTGVADVTGAQVFTKFYIGSLNEDGAKKTAREFAADILSQFGAKTLIGSKIYFVHEQPRGVKEIWSMDYDGSNQRPLTSYKAISITPSVSPDGSRLAFTSDAKGGWRILVHLLETNRFLPFLNPQSSLNATPSFTPDGKEVLFSSTLDGRYPQIFIANVDGSNLRRVSNVRAIEMEPKVNPKTGVEMVFVSGRGGLQQIYKMNLDGADPVRLTTGEGEASNPSWHPDGQHIAFAWTRGFAPGNWNVFIMDVASRETVQLTHGAGRNENPTWAPDGRHLVFASNRNGSMQIYTMLADGTEVRQLTSQGINTMPVWGK
jgi:TolB protein